jgi:hypothetical protein
MLEEVTMFILHAFYVLAGIRKAAFAFLLTLPVLFIGNPVPATCQAPGQDETINARAQAEIIDSITATINRIYVYPEMAEKMEKHVRDKYKNGDYKEITSALQFGDKLTEDLLEICHDRHLGVRYMVLDEETQRMLTDTIFTPEQRQREFEELARNNFAFKKLEHLPGNIGYMDLRGFNDAYYGGQTAIAAMNFFAHVDALIIDLRQNGGGSPSMIQLISSYLFEDPVHLNSFYIRESDTIKQFWTQAFVQGPRLTDVDVYVLTSDYTFSAAEEFTYNLKNLKRATIIGETTGGGAHPVSSFYFSNLRYGVRVPFGKAINPISGTNWEGTGIEPDIAVPQEQALDVARMEAMKKIAEKTEDEERKAALQWDINFLNATLHPVEVDEKLLKEYAGSYGPRQIWYENGVLWYQREDRPKNKLIAMSEDTFVMGDATYFKLQFVRDETGKISKVVGHYQSGHKDESPRDE